MAASLVKSLAKLCIHAQKVSQFIVLQKINVSLPQNLSSSFHQYAGFRNQTSLLNRKQTVFSAIKIDPLVVSQSFFHTTPACATTYERKLWREQRVINRFYRLHWGAWIRTFGGRHKGLYKKTAKERFRLKQHVFCNKTQCRKLDVLVTEHWRKPKYFVDTPYDPYQTRTNCSYFPVHKKFYP